MKRGRPRKWIIYTHSCSGCFEGGEYMGLAHNYPYDTKANCHIGSGCEECGYTGKRREKILVETLAEEQGMTVSEFNNLPED